MATKKQIPRKKTSGKPKASQQSIKKRAQEIYEERISKGIEGTAESDWLQAEKELM